MQPQRRRSQGFLELPAQGGLPIDSADIPLSYCQTLRSAGARTACLATCQLKAVLPWPSKPAQITPAYKVITPYGRDRWSYANHLTEPNAHSTP